MHTEARHSTAKRHTAFALVMAGLACVFIGLGTWQVQRLFWKLDLIARVDARVHAAAIPVPAPAEWPSVSAETAEYRHVAAQGTFLHDKEVFVQAVTERGPGFWVVTPLKMANQNIILINRGYVPADRRDPATRPGSQPTGDVTVTGLLRITEPGGGFLRSNDPAAGRWYSRDVAAIAMAERLENVAPYFVDADRASNAGEYPVGGLTVIQFRNSHLVYAITWYSLAAMSIGASIYLFRRRPVEPT